MQEEYITTKNYQISKHNDILIKLHSIITIRDEKKLTKNHQAAYPAHNETNIILGINRNQIMN